MTPPHPLRRRYLAEDLVRLRPANEQRRYVASQRSGRVDPNPHQIEAVVFALKRIPEGGCILADEVGLGKTIEAGLVIAQLLAEGAQRVLLITPKALLGQWRQELFTLFGVTAVEWEPGVDLAVPGVFLVTRDFAGGERGADVLGGAPPFDLCVIDEAHEVFAGLYKRFDRYGAYQADSAEAKMAGRTRALLSDTPVLLLTATPMQNSLTELWGLAQFVEPTGTLLGDLATFRAMFCAGDDRRLVEGTEHELQRRVAQICQRTLRRQAQDFMKKPFVGRRAQLFQYAMSPEERALYEDVTAYLLEPGICAFRGNQRRLLLIGFHRRMASSVPALAASLERVAQRLEKLLAEARGGGDAEGGSAGEGLAEGETAAALLDDLEEEDRPEETDVDEGRMPPPEVIEAEITRVRALAHRARTLPSDAKAQALVRAVRTVLERGARGEGLGKVVVFTESITTQEYLRSVLRDSGLVSDEEITLFRGQNDGPRPRQALERWYDEALGQLPRTSRPTKEIAVRLALVHEFRTRSKVFISTEAGAKGLNLQFAGTLVNYDLPWNPQRIEQRIGRIHRYGQTKDVLVINFAAEGNAAQQLTLEILTQKLDLFGTVLDASDVVLHEASAEAPETLVGALGADFEARLRRIYERARTQAEIEVELLALRESIAEERARFEEAHARTATLIERRFDEQVKQSFRRIEAELPGELARFDRDLERVVTGYLDAVGAPYERRVAPGGARLVVQPCAALPEPLRAGFVAQLGDARGGGSPGEGASGGGGSGADAVGPGEGALGEGAPGGEEVEPLHLGHPLVRAALEEARAATSEALALRLEAPAGLVVGARGRLRLVRVAYDGYERVEELVPVVVLEGDPDGLDRALAEELLAARAEDAGPSGSGLAVDVSDDDLDEALSEALFDAGGAVSHREQARFGQAIAQIETSIEDRVRVLDRRRVDAQAKVEEAEALRQSAVGSEARTRAERAVRKRTEALEVLEAEIDRLRRRDDQEYSRWMERAHRRRSRPPEVETLLEARFELVGPDA